MIELIDFGKSLVINLGKLDYQSCRLNCTRVDK